MSSPATTAPVLLFHELDGPPDAPVLLLLGSLGSTLRMWEPQRSGLRDRWRVLTVDHRGHGRSPLRRGPYTVADLGGDVLAVLDELGIPTASVCGLSLGGAVAQWLAVHAPERVDRLVLCCTSARFGEPEPWHERAAAVRAGGTRAVADTVVGRWFTEPYARAHPDEVRTARAMIADTPAEGYAACCEAIAGWDGRPDLGRITAPTLVVSAAGDPATPPDHGRVLADGIPGARLEILPEAAHLASFERADEVNALLKEMPATRS